MFKLLVLSCTVFAVLADDPVRGCYFTNWAQYRPGKGKYDLSTYIPGLCTHIYYAFAGVNADFTAKNTDPTDLSTLYKQVNDLKQKDPGLKTLLSFGGANFPATTFSTIAGSDANRQKFAQSAIAFAKQYGFDGVDIDWEFPTAADKTSFTALIAELKKQGGGLLVTAAVSAGAPVIEAGYEGAPLGAVIDILNVMAYDFHGTWEQTTGANAPLYAPAGSVYSVDGAIQAWIKLGFPANKIAMGIATYGRGWTVSGQNVALNQPATGATPSQEFTQTQGVAAYYEICQLVPGGQSGYDDTAQIPYVQQGSNWFSYDNEKSITAKCNYVKQKGLKGAFVWTLDEDDFSGSCPGGKKYPLVGTIAQVLGGKTIN